MDDIRKLRESFRLFKNVFKDRSDELTLIKIFNETPQFPNWKTRPPIIFGFSHFHPFYEMEDQRIIKLSLTNFRLKELSSEIGNFTQLRFLNLKKNRLTELPDTFIQLLSLIHI